MPRIAPLLICACWIASDPGSAAAQSVQLPKCDLDVVRSSLANRQVQPIVGCRVEDVKDILRRYDFAIREHPDPTVIGVEAGTILSVKPGPSVLDLSVSTGAGFPPEVVRPKFSILAPQKVQEGEPLTFTIRRSDSDGRAHPITLSAKPFELLKGALAPIDFSSDRTDYPVTIETAQGQPGDGDKTLEIALSTDESADVGEAARITIVDTAPTTYAVSALQNAMRGEPVVFEVTRTGALTPALVEFDFMQGGTRIRPDGVPHPLRFAAGEASKKLRLSADAYVRCGPPPRLILYDGPDQVEESASFSDSCAGPSPKTLLERLQEDFPWWPIPAALLALGLTTYVLRKFIWPPAPALYPSWGIEPGLQPVGPGPPRLPGWPRFSTRVAIEWGGASVPEPLPIVETNDG